jgi:K+-sensing histidine kinase KdpD
MPVSFGKRRMMFFDPVKRFAIRPVTERTAARTQNLGLGLYVVKEIVAAHDGDITYRHFWCKGKDYLPGAPPRKTPHRSNSNLSEQTADKPAGSTSG